jgi:PTH1 family peptidyl-tRNA hydrolase
MGYIAMKYLIVGLGNIGDDYVGTRHNIGFEVVESLGKKFGGEWKSVKHGSLCEVSHKGRKLLLLKPNTYMNLSGKAVSFWMQAERIKLENVVIITDDLALPVAKLRLKSKGSDGGHNGLKSIQSSLSTTNYARLRFGIGSEFSQGRQVDFVLGKFTTEERSSIDIAIDRAVEGTLQYCTLGAGFAMNYTNT